MRVLLERAHAVGARFEPANCERPRLVGACDGFGGTAHVSGDIDDAYTVERYADDGMPRCVMQGSADGRAGVDDEPKVSLWQSDIEGLRPGGPRTDDEPGALGEHSVHGDFPSR